MSTSTVPDKNQKALVLVVGIDINRTLRGTWGDSVVFEEYPENITNESISSNLGHVLLGNRLEPRENRRIIDLAMKREKKVQVGVTPADVSSRLQDLVGGWKSPPNPPTTPTAKENLTPAVTPKKGDEERMANSNEKVSLNAMVREWLGKKSPLAVTTEDRNKMLELFEERGRPTSRQQLTNALTWIKKGKSPKKTPATKKRGAKPNGNDKLLLRFDTWLAEGQELREMVAKLSESKTVKEIIESVKETLEQYR